MRFWLQVRFWFRELAGWALVALGLFMFYLSYAMLMQHMIWEAGQWSVVGIIVFRGGIHLLKVAVAARVCMQAVEEISGDRPGSLPRTPGRPQRPTLSQRGLGSRI
jgi:hypothetical protein